MKLLIHSQTATVEVWEWLSNFTPTLYNECHYLYMLGLKVIHVSKRDHWCLNHHTSTFFQHLVQAKNKESTKTLYYWHVVRENSTAVLPSKIVSNRKAFVCHNVIINSTLYTMYSLLMGFHHHAWSIRNTNCIVSVRCSFQCHGQNGKLLSWTLLMVSI